MLLKLEKVYKMCTVVHIVGITKPISTNGNMLETRIKLTKWTASSFRHLHKNDTIFNIRYFSTFILSFILIFAANGANEQIGAMEQWKNVQIHSMRMRVFEREKENANKWNEFTEKLKHLKNFLANVNAEQID